MAKKNPVKKKKAKLKTSKKLLKRHAKAGKKILAAALGNLAENTASPAAAAKRETERAKRESKVKPVTARFTPPELNEDGTLMSPEGGGDDQGPQSMSWSPYEGPRGGSGWQNDKTGEIRYQEDEPLEYLEEEEEVNEHDGDDYFDPEAFENIGGYKSRDILVHMSPDQFISLAEHLDQPSPEKQDRVRGLLEQGIQFESLPHLSFSHDGQGNAKVQGHEGRHRAMALKSLGVESIPVVLTSLGSRAGSAIRWDQQEKADNFDRIKGKWPKVLKGESGGSIDFPVADPLGDQEEPEPEIERTGKPEKREGITPPMPEELQKTLKAWGVDSVDEMHRIAEKQLHRLFGNPTVVEPPEEKYLTGVASRGEKKPGMCFVESTRYALKHLYDDRVKVVHGTVLGRDNMTIAHGWIEIDDKIVYDGANQEFYDKQDYYDFTDAQVEKTYKTEEAMRHMTTSGHYGAWHESAGRYIDKGGGYREGEFRDPLLDLLDETDEDV